MEGATQTVKEFSPYGWGITVLILVLQFVNVQPNKYNADRLSRIEVRLEVLETNYRSITTSLNALESSLITNRKISCFSLNLDQRRVVDGCSP